MIDFLKQQTCATLCCVDANGKPYCFSCFYAFNPDERLLYFKSSSNSHHVSIISSNPLISGTVLPDRINSFSIKGLQLEGIIDINRGKQAEVNASYTYHKKFPMAMLIPGQLFIVCINDIKMTDSTGGLRKKMLWHRD